MANLPSKLLDFRGFDSSRIVISRGGIPRSIGNLPESSSQRILVGIILVGRSIVRRQSESRRAFVPTRETRRCDHLTILYYTILYYTILYYTILYYTILYDNILILYYTILYYTILYYTILYYTILY